MKPRGRIIRMRSDLNRRPLGEPRRFVTATNPGFPDGEPLSSRQKPDTERDNTADQEQEDR